MFLHLNIRTCEIITAVQSHDVLSEQQENPSFAYVIHGPDKLQRPAKKTERAHVFLHAKL